MHGFMWRGAAVTLALALGACSVAEEGPNCSSEAARSVLTQLLWDDIEQQFTATAGAQNTKPFMDITRTQMQIQVSGITTLEKSKDVRRVRCEATLTTTLPDTVTADLSLLRTAIAKEPGNVRLEDRTLTSPVEYSVQVSDDLTTTRVEARGFKTYTEVVNALGSTVYIEAAQRQALANEAAAGKAAPNASVQGRPREEGCGASSADLHACAFEELEAADRALNAAYAAARSKLDVSGQAELRDAQRMWIKQRDTECSEEKITADYKDGAPGGSAITLEIVGCKTSMTTTRTKQLLAIKG